MRGSCGLIVLVEDDPHEAEIFRTVIRKLGVNSFVRVYSNGFDALRMIAENAESEFKVGLFVLDIDLPDINGTSLCEAIIASIAANKPRIAFLTHLPSRRSKEICESNPDIALLTKPRKMSEYSQLIWKLVDFSESSNFPQIA